ncbi:MULTISPECIES: IclR family transcriptional regulator [unclassified Mycolicibacterium]|uniref:IclR family transcriptional regulator n=1 Tax=unclassified Mycolicibacterium TaxID=2636767 RepID=UPI002ED8E64F
MRDIRVVQRPRYAIEAVDHALQLLLLMQERDDVGVSEAAAIIGTANSTAHRLLTTLAYRGFAEQDDRHRYRLGPAAKLATGDRTQLNAILRPHLIALRETTGETVSAMVLHRLSVKLLLTAESAQRLRITDRTGSILPAISASAGKALLAELRTADLHRLFSDSRDRSGGDDLGPAGLARLERELRQVRRSGVAFNDGRTESGLAAVGCAVPAPEGNAWLGLAVSVPIGRVDRVHDAELHVALRRCAAAIGTELASRGISGLAHADGQLLRRAEHGSIRSTPPHSG